MSWEIYARKSLRILMELILKQRESSFEKLINQTSGFAARYAERLCLSEGLTPKFLLRLCLMRLISKDKPCHYLTSVVKDRLQVFRTEKIKTIARAALDEARKSGSFAIYAYVIMPDHLHTITDDARKPSELLRYVNGIISHRVIGYLKENKFESSLAKLRHEDKARGYKYSLWEHHNNAKPLFSEAVFMQKVNYLHLNPVRAELVERAEDYRWSSARCWKRCPLDDEPLIVDIDRLVWRRS
jgi:REP element-mobilizing transposase RayT